VNVSLALFVARYRSAPMRRFLLAALLVSSVAAPRQADAKDKDKGKDREQTGPVTQNADDCAEVQASARYVGYGYTHVVTLKNACTKAVECALWSDVDPEPRTTVQADPGQTAEVVTRRGSPSRDVTGYKSCRFR
jgi:hypothetical protein